MQLPSGLVGSPCRLKTLDIDWEYPPDSFQLELTNDGLHWYSAYSVSSGSMKYMGRD